MLKTNSKLETEKSFIASDYASDGKFHLLLAASGSVATIKIPNIIGALSRHKDLAIRLILTKSAEHFLAGQSKEQPSVDELLKGSNVEAIYRDEDEWTKPWVRNAPILHIELRRWADMLVIAPLSANTLAKISNGICDDLLTSTVRAWEVQPMGGELTKLEQQGVQIPGQGQKMIIVAPAMNTFMWKHPLTEQQLRTSVGQWPWFTVLHPIQKELACGDTGDGAMCDWKHIVGTIENSMELYPMSPSRNYHFQKI